MAPKQAQPEQMRPYLLLSRLAEEPKRGLFRSSDLLPREHGGDLPKAQVRAKKAEKASPLSCFASPELGR